MHSKSRAMLPAVGLARGPGKVCPSASGCIRESVMSEALMTIHGVGLAGGPRGCEPGRTDSMRTIWPRWHCVLAPVEIRTYSLARWRFCRQHRVAAMESGAADVDRAPRGALWNPMTMMKLLMLGAAAA